MKDRTRSKDTNRPSVQRKGNDAAPGRATRVQRRYGEPRGADRQVQATMADPTMADPTTAIPTTEGIPATQTGPAPDQGADRDQESAATPLTEPEARAAWQRKETLRTHIDAQITQEDAMREDGARKARTTRAQLTTQLVNAQTAGVAARAALDSGTCYEAPLRAFETAVDALHGAYLASAMESTDGPAAAFAPSADLDALGSGSAQAKISAWQAASRERYSGTVKFAVPPLASTGGVLVCRIGNPMTMGHNDVAGGDAIAAGFIRVSATGNTVTAFENTSGGYRPGSLRNATARQAIEAAQPVRYTVADNARRDNSTGSYDTSTVYQPPSR